MTTFKNLSESSVRRLAEELAFAVQAGDTVALEGDLGAGKTTFARALIAALCAQDHVEVPSPTFTLVQSYKAPRFEIAHFDLYRLGAPEELYELGLDHALRAGLAIVEWPARAQALLPENRWDLVFAETSDAACRDVTMTGTGTVAERAARFHVIRDFLAKSGWGGDETRVRFLQGDASPRRYARLIRNNAARALLMDAPRQPDGPPVRDGLPYSRIAHLAEDVRPFVSIAEELTRANFRAPQILAHDIEQGLLIIEDLGDGVFGREVSQGASQSTLWRRGVDVLIALRQHPPPASMALPDGSHYGLPLLDHSSLRIESELLLDWYWPALKGSAAPPAVRAQFHEVWDRVFARILKAPAGWLLRDYHSPNLIALETGESPRDVGVIDFQDALRGPVAYDLVSLLQDARLDVSAQLEAELFDHYITCVKRLEPGFDASEFKFLYAALGAQRNTKILGIFARLAKRDGKRGYLAHIPRIWGYLARNLAHPELTELAAWYDVNFNAADRKKPLSV